jgi:hypothetical protein
MDSELAPGKIVRDTSPDSIFFGKQGKILSISPARTVIVRFPTFMVPYEKFRWSAKKKPMMVTYVSSDVDGLVCEEHWDQKPFTLWACQFALVKVVSSLYILTKVRLRKGRDVLVAGCEDRRPVVA